MNEINFLPQSYRARLHARIRHVRQVGLVVVVTLAMAAYWAYGLTGGMMLRRAAEGAEDQLANALSRESQVLVLREQKKTLAEARGIQRELRVPIRYFEVLNVLGTLVPEPVALRELVFDNKRPAPKPFVAASDPTKNRPQPAFTVAKTEKKAEPDVMNITIEGLAPDDLSVAELIAGMSSTALFSDVKLRSSRFTETQGVAARQFRISAQIDLGRDYVFTPAAPAAADLGSDPADTSASADLHGGNHEAHP